MEKVVELSETPAQKQRAADLMNRFEMTEMHAVLRGAEPIPPNGVVTSWKEALAVCKNIAGCVPYLKLKQAVKLALMKEPGGRKIIKSNISGVLNFNPCTALAEQLCLVARFAGNKKVKAALKTIAGTLELPEGIRMMAGFLAGSSQFSNLFPEGGFESPDSLTSVDITGVGAGSQKLVKAVRGGHGMAMQVNPGSGTELCKTFRVRENSLYLVTFRIFLPNGTSENFIRSTVFGGKDGHLGQWWEVSKTFVPAGTWVTQACLGEAPGDWNTLGFTLHMGNFEPEQKVLVDDLQVVCLGDYTKAAERDLSKAPAQLSPQDGFQNIPLLLCANCSLAHDIANRSIRYDNGTETQLLKGSKSSHHSHFFYNGSDIKANPQATYSIRVRVKGRGTFTCGAYVRDRNGKFLRTMVRGTP